MILKIDELPFPRIRFRFLNSGKILAPMLEYRLHIVSAEIDTTPCFRYGAYATNDGALDVVATNVGWGDGGLSLSFSESIINSLFSDKIRHASVKILSGESKSLFRFHPRKMSAVHRARLPPPSAEYQNGWVCTVDSIDDSSRHGLRLKEMTLVGSTKGHDGRVYREKAVLYSCSGDTLTGYQQIVLHKEGFCTVVTERALVCYCARMPDTKYVCIVDPDRGAYSRAYKVSRDILPTESDVFDVTIGARKSCRLQLRFEFMLAEGVIIQSDLLSVAIKFDRNDAWPSNLEDGIAFQRIAGVWQLVGDEGFPLWRRSPPDLER